MALNLYSGTQVIAAILLSTVFYIFMMMVVACQIANGCYLSGSAD